MYTSLNDIHGVFWSGTVAAVLGPSDSGKTELSVLEAVKLANERMSVAYISFDTVQDKLETLSNRFFDLKTDTKVPIYLKLVSQFDCYSLDECFSHNSSLVILDPIDKLAEYLRIDENTLFKSLKEKVRQKRVAVLAVKQVSSSLDISQEFDKLGLEPGLSLHVDNIFNCDKRNMSCNLQVLKSNAHGAGFNFNVHLVPIK